MPNLWQIKMAAAERKDDDMEMTRFLGRGIIEVRVPQEESLAGKSDGREEILFIPGAPSTPIPTPHYEALLKENEKLKEENDNLKRKLEENDEDKKKLKEENDNLKRKLKEKQDDSRNIQAI